MDILLVEDNPGDIRLAQEAFRESQNPVNLHVARDGVEAMFFLRREGSHVHAPRPDLILLDLNLPKMDGREVLTKIKTNSDLKTIPTLILTTSIAESDLEYCYENCANCYVTKPKDWDSFVHVVRAVNDFWCGSVKLPSDAHIRREKSMP
jgi:chemotaxis family two-component system response regulator Rcp1